MKESEKQRRITTAKTFKIFQDAIATVEYVKGEFYWRVNQGENVRAIDYVKAPLMLSQEKGANEINWSLGTYKTNKEIEEIFGVSDLPKPWSVAPNQPFTGSFYYTYGAIPLLLLFVVAIFMLPISGIKSTVLAQEIVLQPMTNATTAQTVFTQPFEIKGNRNVRIYGEFAGNIKIHGSNSMPISSMTKITKSNPCRSIWNIIRARTATARGRKEVRKKTQRFHRFPAENIRFGWREVGATGSSRFRFASKSSKMSCAA